MVICDDNPVTAPMGLIATNHFMAFPTRMATSSSQWLTMMDDDDMLPNRTIRNYWADQVLTV